jgi:hypothetical protein
MNIFEQLRKDHDKQRELCDQLLKTEGASESRKKLYKALKHELKIHADAEERYFYIPLFEDKMTQEKARHSVAEHHEMDELMEKLDELDMSSSQWLITFKELEHQVTHHLDEEEQEVFQLAGKALTETQKEELAKSYQGMMNQAG